MHGHHPATPTTPTGHTPAWRIAAGLPDPELPLVTIADLGILRDVTEDDQGRVHVQVAPTHPGCPAMEAISSDLVEALADAGYQHVDVEFVLSPPWTSDWISAGARAALANRHAAYRTPERRCCSCPDPAGPADVDSRLRTR